MENIQPGKEAQVYAQVTMQLGLYTGMMFQAAVQFAEKVGKDAKHKAKIVTICADLVIVGVTAAVASHFPPALAVIPAGMTFVSTHVVPFFVPKTDFRTPFIHLRAAAKAASMAKLTQPINNFSLSVSVMQERQFFHDLFFSQWDVIADATA